MWRHSPRAGWADITNHVDHVSGGEALEVRRSFRLALALPYAAEDLRSRERFQVFLGCRFAPRTLCCPFEDQFLWTQPFFSGNNPTGYMLVSTENSLHSKRWCHQRTLFSRLMAAQNMTKCFERWGHLASMQRLTVNIVFWEGLFHIQHPYFSPIVTKTS